MLSSCAGPLSLGALDFFCTSSRPVSWAIWACIRAGYQAALLAPTEILASQHAENLNRLLSPFGMRVALLTGGMKAAARRTTLAAIPVSYTHLTLPTKA